MKRSVVSAIWIALALAGCSNDTNDDGIIGPPANGSQSTQLTGVFANTSVSGLLDVTIDTSPLAPAWQRASAANVTALGTLSPDVGGTVNLSGTYDPDTDSLRLTGGGYTLAGVYLPGGVPPRLTGRFTGPLGAGSFVALAGSRTAVRTFCATYENQDASLWGTLNFAISGTTVTGFEVEDGDTLVVALTGSVSATGTPRTLSFVGASFQGNGTWDQAKDQVQGEWAGYVQSGAYQVGVWSGEACVPGTTGSEGAARLTRVRRGAARR